MDTLQQAFDHILDGLPGRFFEELLLRKLRDTGIPATTTLSRKLAMHILNGNSEPFTYKSRRHHMENVTLTLDEADLNDIASKLDSFAETQLPTLLETASGPISKHLLKTLKLSWPTEAALQQNDFREFRKRLEERWGIPLSQLRMLLTIAREWCQETCNRDRSLKIDKQLDLRDILIRLLVRACQVTDEIICLLENGFADGAMARWRTLHEIGIVAAVISQHGEDLVERYVAHQAVESKRAMDKYTKSCEELGYKPMSERACKKINKAYEAAVARYGAEFKGDYGWAAAHLKKKRPTFADLEVDADRAEMRAYYQMGNDNIHAGVKSMFVRLGLLEDYTDFLGGRSNAGLMDPGQNAAHTLTQIAVLVCLSEGNLDDRVFAQVMMNLRDEIPRSFHQAHRKLRRDDRKYKRVRAQPSPDQGA